jgi:hypothetical protein
MRNTRGIDPRHWVLTVFLLLTFGAGARADIIGLTAILTGPQEVPPNVSTGIGTAALILDTTQKTLITSATFSNLTSPTALESMGSLTATAFLQVGNPGQTGPAAHAFITTPVGVTSGSFTDIWVGLSNQDILNIEHNGTYINL